MPSAVHALLENTAVDAPNVVAWGERIGLVAPGIYLVSSTSDPDGDTGPGEAQVSPDRCQDLLDARPELTLDGKRPDAASLCERMAAFWLPDEPVIYIGLAGTSVASRVGDYYRTPLGARRPHAGGWFLKTLSILPELWVHFAACDDPAAAEAAALEAFAAGVSESTRAQLHDPERVMPFANLEYPKGVRKGRGISGAREPRERSTRGTAAVSHPPNPTEQENEADSTTSRHMTQRITAADLRVGQIRIPALSKVVFPPATGRVAVDLRGERFDCRWDPRPGRSGVIGIGKAKLAVLVSEGEVLRVGPGGDVVRLI